jgi:hypothetical protein
MYYFNYIFLINSLVKSANFVVKKLLIQFFNFFAYKCKGKINENDQFCSEKKKCR